MIMDSALVVLLILAIIVLPFFTVSSSNISRADFPHGFTFGTASSAYQVSSINGTATLQLL